MVTFKENYHFPRFQRGPTFTRRGSKFFQRGGGGGGRVQLLIPIETYIACDFPGGPDLVSPPLDPPMRTLR